MSNMLLRRRCLQHPEHEVPTSRSHFSLRDLPPLYRDPNILDAVKVVADCTVQIVISYTSKYRPASIRFQSLARTYAPRLASGFLYDFDKSSGILHGECPCTECRKSKTPEKQFAKFYVLVANHSVFDDLEAQYTACKVSYNDDMHRDCVGTLYECRIIHSDRRSDICFLEVVTHDIDLSKRLIHMLNRCAFLLQKCSEVINAINSHLSLNPIAVIVSHPHGCCQTITVGRVWYDDQNDNFTPDNAGCKLQTSEWDRLVYETPTCRGPSGALVFVLKAGLRILPLTVHSRNFGNHVNGSSRFLKTNLH